MIRYVTDAKHHLKNYKPCDPSEQQAPPTFVTRDFNLTDVKALFGDLEFHQEKGSDYEKTIGASRISNIKIYGDPEVISTFYIQDGVSRVACVSDTQAWVVRIKSNDVSLVTKDGVITQTVTSESQLWDLVVNKNNQLIGVIIAADGVKSKIIKLTPGGTFYDLYNRRDEYRIHSITVANNNDIIALLYNSEKGTDGIIQLTPNGEFFRILYKCRNYENLHNFWRCISSNRNDDIIVSRLGDRDVVDIFDKSCSTRFIYNGQGQSLGNAFKPSYVTTDQYGHVFISDYSNSVIHVLGKDRQFLQFIALRKHGLQQPYGLSIDPTGRLWACSTGNNKTMIVKYV